MSRLHIHFYSLPNGIDHCEYIADSQTLQKYNQAINFYILKRSSSHHLLLQQSIQQQRESWDGFYFYFVFLCFPCCHFPITLSTNCWCSLLSVNHSVLKSTKASWLFQIQPVEIHFRDWICFTLNLHHPLDKKNPIKTLWNVSYFAYCKNVYTEENQWATA